jgi:GNAT superfamily N-acetyltransferase
VPESAPWDILRLDRSHKRDGFDCGVPPLNEWLQHLAGQFERRDLARTYVAMEKGRKEVLGYYAVLSHQVRFDALTEDQAKGLPTIDIPVVLLGRLAVDRSVQGQGLGEHLLIDALRRAAYISQHIGIRAVEVDALGETARRFYLKHGFTPLRDDPQHLFLSMHVIRKLDLPPM